MEANYPNMQMESRDEQAVGRINLMVNDILSQLGSQVQIQISNGLDSIRRDLAQPQTEAEHVSVTFSPTRAVLRFFQRYDSGRRFDELQKSNERLHEVCLEMERTLAAVADERDRLKVHNERGHTNLKEIHDLLENARQQNQAQDVEIKTLKNQLNEHLAHVEAKEQISQQWIEKSEALELKQVELHSTIEVLGQKNKEFHDQAAKYRAIIIQKNDEGSNQINDAVIISSFRSLREQIQRIIVKFYTMEKDMPSSFLNKLKPKQQELLKHWQRDLTTSELQNRVRASVFQCLSDILLFRPCFGLKGGDVAKGVESGLVKFEGMLGHFAQDHEADIMAWRALTMKCAKWLCPNDSDSCVEPYVQTIWNLLSYLRKHYHENAIAEKEKDKLVKLLFRLCTDAYDLTLLLRGCKDVYRCEFPTEGKALNTEDAEPQGEEKKSTKEKVEGEIVAFSLSGALVRYPEHNPEERIVLEKAHVVLEC